MAGTLCNFATQLKFVFGYDDCLDVRPLSLPRSFALRVCVRCAHRTKFLL